MCISTIILLYTCFSSLILLALDLNRDEGELEDKQPLKEAGRSMS